MPMATSSPATHARNFVFWGIVASLGLFGGLRLPWFESQVVLPLTRMQAGLAVAMFGTPSLPVAVTLACSGADALALCVGAVLAYPVPWPWRVAGAAGGIAWILALNTLRIASLSAVADSPDWFAALHLYGWPALLILAIAGYVFAWMHVAGRPVTARVPVTPSLPNTPLSAAWQPSIEFMVITAVFVIAFVAASPWYLESSLVLALGEAIAVAAAAVLQAAGVTAHASANLLATPQGTFVVTQECISTPLIPVYLAAVCTYSSNWRRVLFGVLATLPVFTALGMVRLLLVAVPVAGMTAPTFLVHAFYQLLLGAVVILLAARWRHGGRVAITYAAAGLAVGCLFAIVLGPAYAWLITPRAVHGLDDPQGAIAFLPAFQVALYLALAIAAQHAARWTRFMTGLGMLMVTQIGGLLALQALDASGIALQVRDVRAWAVAGPVLIFATVVTRARTPR